MQKCVQTACLQLESAQGGHLYVTRTELRTERTLQAPQNLPSCLSSGNNPPYLKTTTLLISHVTLWDGNFVPKIGGQMCEWLWRKFLRNSLGKQNVTLGKKTKARLGLPWAFLDCLLDLGHWATMWADNGQWCTSDSCPHGVYRQVTRRCLHSTLRARIRELVWHRRVEGSLRSVTKASEKKASNGRP